MIVTYPIHPLSYASSAYGDYATAREAEAGITGEWFWLGIYDAGHQFEINQLMLGFDTSNKPALPIADVTLELPIEEAYGLTKVVILHYDWIIGDGSYVKGSEVDSLPILAEFTVNEGDGGSVFIKLNASELPDISRLALVPEAMRYPVYDGSGDDTTLIIDTGVKLHVTFKETPAIEAEVEGILEAVAVASGSPVVDSSGVAAINLNGGAEAVAIVNAAMTAYVPPDGLGCRRCDQWGQWCSTDGPFGLSGGSEHPCSPWAGRHYPNAGDYRFPGQSGHTIRTADVDCHGHGFNEPQYLLD